MKLTNKGYKVCVRAGQRGSMCQLQIYSGKVHLLIRKKLGSRVVEDLTRTQLHKNHKVYFDNYYYYCGTVHKVQKNLPQFKTDKQLKRGVSVDCVVALK